MKTERSIDEAVAEVAVALGYSQRKHRWSIASLAVKMFS